MTSGDDANSGSTVTWSPTGLDLIRISQKIGLSFFEATPLTKALRVFTDVTSESESRQWESWFTERIFSFMAQTSEPSQWFILRQTLHLLLHAGHSSFFRTRDCEQKLDISSCSSVFFLQMKLQFIHPVYGSPWKDHWPFGAPCGLFIFSTKRLEVSRRALRSSAYINTSLQVELSFLK